MKIWRIRESTCCPVSALFMATIIDVVFIKRFIEIRYCCGNPICNFRHSTPNQPHACETQHWWGNSEKLIKSSHLIYSFELRWFATESPLMRWIWEGKRRPRRHMKINKRGQFQRQLSSRSKSKWPLVNYVNAIMFCEGRNREEEMSTADEISWSGRERVISFFIHSTEAVCDNQFRWKNSFFCDVEWIKKFCETCVACWTVKVLL